MREDTGWVLTKGSSAVLWVAQNMEDEYTYNLAL